MLNYRLAFRPFAGLFANNGMGVPAAILTDADPKDNSTESNAAAALRKLEQGTLRVFVADRTLEYDLALAGNAEVMAEVYCQLHPKKGPEVVAAVQGADGNDGRAIAFWDGFDRKRDKAVFAQLLAARIASLPSFHLPAYIEGAIRHVIA